MQLRPLSHHDSIKLIKFYCLRHLDVDEFDDNNHTADLESLDSDDHHEQICDALQKHNNFKACEGFPAFLMILAFTLRVLKMKQIAITQ
jgi:hypothetical protein